MTFTPAGRVDRQWPLRAAAPAGALKAYDEAVGLDLENLVVGGCIVKAPGGGQNTGRSPVDRGKSGLRRSVLVDGGGLPLGWVLAGANRNDSPLLRPTLETLRLSS